MFESLGKLFAEMQPIVVILFVVGIILCMVEIFQPGMGIFGGLGIGAIVLGIVLRLLNQGDIFMFIWLVLGFFGIGGTLFFLVLKSIKSGRLSRSSIFNVGEALPRGKTEGTNDFTSFVGKEGLTVSPLRPVGQGQFDGVIFDVIAQTGLIDANEKVIIVEVEGQRVIVKKA